MWRLGFRISKSALYSFLLVTGTFWAILLLLHVMERVTVRHPLDTAGRTGGAEVSGDGRLPGIRRWMPRPVVGRGMTYATSPYNADNKRKLTAQADPGSGVKVISWRASRTLRVLSSTSDVFAACPVSACQVSPSAKSLQRAAAIVFDEGRMAKQTPPQLKADRVLVYYNMRTPSEQFFRTKGDLFAQYWRRAVNWVWSYRLDADIFQPFAYIEKSPQQGRLHSVTDSVRRKGRLAVWLNPKVSPREDGLEDIDSNLHKARSASGVEDYLRDLRKAMDYDTMDMVHLQAAMATRGRKGQFALTKYYFVLAFEWVTCPDYVTDLLFAAYDPRVQAVPVVRGGFNYSLHLPPDTYVNADDFAGPRELARHLEELASDTKAYSRLLWRKNQYRRQDGLQHAWCQLCDMLHRLPGDPTLSDRYDDVQAWFQQGSGCAASNTTE